MCSVTGAGSRMSALPRLTRMHLKGIDAINVFELMQRMFIKSTVPWTFRDTELLM